MSAPDTPLEFEDDRELERQLDAFLDGLLDRAEAKRLAAPKWGKPRQYDLLVRVQFTASPEAGSRADGMTVQQSAETLLDALGNHIRHKFMAGMDEDPNFTVEITGQVLAAKEVEGK